MDERKPRLGRGSSHLVYLLSLCVCFGASVLASFFDMAVLGAFLLFLFFLCLVSRLWGLASLRRLSVELECPVCRLVPGQETTVRYRAHNN